MPLGQTATKSSGRERDLRGRDSSDTRQKPQPRDRGFLVRQVIVLKVAMDESGVHDGSPVIAVAAYVARPRQWQDWTKRWNVAKRPIKVMHAVDCQNLTDEFKGWLREQRDELENGSCQSSPISTFPASWSASRCTNSRRRLQGAMICARSSEPLTPHVFSGSSRLS